MFPPSAGRRVCGPIPHRAVPCPLGTNPGSVAADPHPSSSTTPERSNVMNIQLTKDALIDALNAKREEAIEYDKANAKAHAAAEKQWLKDVRERLRAAAKINDYQTMVEELCGGRRWGPTTSVEPQGWPERPTCDRLVALNYDRELANLSIDSRKRFTIRDAGQTANLYRLLTQGFAPVAQTVCD